MPINQLERHPFIDDYNHFIDPQTEYSGLIIGSFPIWATTHLVGEDLIVNEEIYDEDLMKFPFFYGSIKSFFWEYTLTSFGVNQDFNYTKENIINFLNDNNLLITDVIYQTNRMGHSGADSDLFIDDGTPIFVSNNLSLNIGLNDILLNHPTLKNLFFTAKGMIGKTPFGWFREIFEGQLEFEIMQQIDNIIWSVNLNINGREYNAFFLPTPKPRGIHFTDNRRNAMFSNYMQSVDPIFFEIISINPYNNRTNEMKSRLTELRISFLVETYRQALVENNLNFDGFI